MVTCGREPLFRDILGQPERSGRPTKNLPFGQRRRPRMANGAAGLGPALFSDFLLRNALAVPCVVELQGGATQPREPEHPSRQEARKREEAPEERPGPFD